MKLLPTQYSEKLEAGTDEAGRGCLAGPVSAAAVIFSKSYSNPDLNDSKKLSEKSTELFQLLAKDFNCDYDESGSIGKRYRRQDEIGTPFCLTVDFDTAEDESVTIRDRDTMQQERIKIADLKAYFEKKLEF